MKQAGEHFERGGFARAVRAEKAHEFARLNREANFLDGNRLVVLTMEKTFERAGKSGQLFVGLKSFGQSADFDDWHGGSLKSKVPMSKVKIETFLANIYRDDFVRAQKKRGKFSAL